MLRVRTNESTDAMMAFRKREAARIFGLRDILFSQGACDSLLRDEHHLGVGFESENICAVFRDDALRFFKARKIKWHGGGSCDTSIVSSQVACLNTFFPFVSDPVALKSWLSKLYPDLAEMLPISSKIEPPVANGQQPFVTFEWIGEKRYLNERWGNRGKHCTSVDVIFRFRTVEGKIHVVLTEFKYCESYEKAKYEHMSKKGTDLVAIYRPHLEIDGCQLVLGKTRFEALFFPPFYQLMRQQLLASAMERGREMDADIVSVLHVAPRANEGMLNLTLSEKVAPGVTVGTVWRIMAKPGRFQSVATEDLIPILIKSGADPVWSKYFDNRYEHLRGMEKPLELPTELLKEADGILRPSSQTSKPLSLGAPIGCASAFPL
jgi:hypothetical protein